LGRILLLARILLINVRCLLGDVAKVAAARRLSVRLFWMLRTHTAYPEIVGIESSPAEALVGES